MHHTDLLLYCRSAYDRTRSLLTEHRTDVEKVAKLLLEKEVITRYVFIRPSISLTHILV
jgi:ATP-dependent Zn protease